MDQQSIEKIGVNLETIMDEQKRAQAIQKRQQRNLETVKRILLQDKIAQLLPASALQEVMDMDVEDVDIVVRPKKVLDKVVKKGDAGTSAVKPDVEKVAKKSDAGSSAKKPDVEKVAKKSDAGTAKQDSREKEGKGGKDGKKARKSEGQGSDVEKSRPATVSHLTRPHMKRKYDQRDAGEIFSTSNFGNPRPDTSNIMPRWNRAGRRVYGVTGSDDVLVKGGAFLLYQLADYDTATYTFDEDVVAEAKASAEASSTTEDIKAFKDNLSDVVDGGAAFVQFLFAAEKDNVEEPVFLNRPIVSMANITVLKDLLNMIPEPLRSAVHRFCKEAGLFKGFDKRELCRLIDELVQRIKPEVETSRLNYPAVTVNVQEFQHPQCD